MNAVGACAFWRAGAVLVGRFDCWRCVVHRPLCWLLTVVLADCSVCVVLSVVALEDVAGQIKTAKAEVDELKKERPDGKDTEIYERWEKFFVAATEELKGLREKEKGLQEEKNLLIKARQGASQGELSWLDCCALVVLVVLCKSTHCLSSCPLGFWSVSHRCP
jgi:hypothetical protein